MMNAPDQGTNPYIGPRPFRTGDTLYGRDWETQELRDLLIARRFVLLHSPSGAGKTSLIQAGLIPALEAEGFRVLPTIRVGMDPPPEVLESDCVFNRFVLSTHISLSNLLTGHDGNPPNMTRLCSSTLDRLFDHVLEGDDRYADGEARSVLIFDQFEEILNVDPLNLDAKQVFFEQLGEALKDRDRWALFALREDYVASLEPYLHEIPTRLSTHFRLEPLRRDAALEAIKHPVQALGYDYAPGVAETLVDDLLTVPMGKSEFVEPVQLQVVCYDLWQYWRTNASPSTTTITQAHLTAFGNVDQALANFYDTSIQTTTRQTGIGERELRHWFDHQLITPAKTRGIVYKGKQETAGIPNTAVNVLDRLHIIRVEPRAGADWVELTHDGFIEPITESNLAWEKREWDRTRRLFRRALIAGATVLSVLVLSLGLLSYLRGQAADQARRDTNAVQATGTALVEIQRTAQAESEREALRATQQAVETQSEQWLTDAQVALQNNDAALALTLALKAYHLNPNLPDIQRVLAEAAYAPGPRSYLSNGAMTTLYNHLALSPDERFAVVAPGMILSSTAGQQQSQQQITVPQDNSLTIWELETGTVAGQLEGLTGQIVAVDYAPGPDSDRILAASQSALTVWDAETGDTLWTFDLKQTKDLAQVSLTSAVLAPDSSTALAGGCKRQYVNGVCIRGIVLRFDLTDSTALPYTIDVEGVGSVTGVGFEPGGLVALAATSQGQIARCSLVSTGSRGGKCLAQAQITSNNDATGAPAGISVMVIDQTRAQALIGTQDGLLLIWDIHTASVSQQLYGGHTGIVRGVDFGKMGEQTALSVADDGQMIWWNLAASTPIRRFSFKQTVMWDVAYRQAGESAITAMSDNSVIWWDLAQGDQKRTIDTLTPVTTLTFAADGSTTLAGYSDGQIKYWETNGISPATFSAGKNAVSVLAASTDPADPAIITQTGANTLLLWRNGVSSPIETNLQEVTDVSFSPDSRTFVAAGCQNLQFLTRACRAGQIALVNTATLAVLQTLDGDADMAGHLRTLSAVDFSPDGHTIVSSSRVGTLLTWDIVSGQASLITPQAIASTINDLDVIPGSGRNLVLAGGCLTRESASQLCNVGVVFVWDIGTDQIVHQFQVRGAEITRVAASPDGQWLLAGASDGTITRWELATGALIFRYTGHTGPVTGLAFPSELGAEGEWFASSSTDAQIIQWRLDSLDRLLTWTERNRYLTTLTCAEQQQYYQTSLDPACQAANTPLPTPEIMAVQTLTPVAAEALPVIPTTVQPLRSPTLTPISQIIRIGEVKPLQATSAPQYWTFDGTARDLLSIALTTDTGRAEGSIILLAPDGKELAFASSTTIDNDVVITGLALPQSGTYTIITQQYDTQGANYALTLTNLRITTATPRPSPTLLPDTPTQQGVY